MNTQERFEKQMEADGWKFNNGCWCKTVATYAIDLAKMYASVNTVNAKPFNGAPPRTLRLLGTNWIREDDRKYVVTYRILAREDMDGIGYDQHPVDGRRIASYAESDFGRAVA